MVQFFSGQSPVLGQNLPQSDYRLDLARALMQGGANSAPVRHPVEGLGRLAQSLSGALIARGAQQDQMARQKAANETLSRALAGMNAPQQSVTDSVMPGAGGGEVTAAFADFDPNSTGIASAVETDLTPQEKVSRLASALAANPDLAPIAANMQVNMAMGEVEAQRKAASQPTYSPVYGPDGKTIVGQRNSITGKVETDPRASSDKPDYSHIKSVDGVLVDVRDGSIVYGGADSPAPPMTDEDLREQGLTPAEIQTFRGFEKPKDALNYLTSRLDWRATQHKNFRSELKPAIDALQEIDRKAGTVFAALEKQNGTADIAAINAYQRLIDDGVVRSEDVRLQGEAVSLAGQLGKWVKRAKEGDLLPQEIRERMQSMTQALVGETLPGIQSRIYGVREVVGQDERLSWGKVFGPSGRELLDSAISRLPEGMRQKAQERADAPFVGSVEGGYRFTGGDPADRSNWKKVGG